MYVIYTAIGGSLWNHTLVPVWRGREADYPAALDRYESLYGLCYVLYI